VVPVISAVPVASGVLVISVVPVIIGVSVAASVLVMTVVGAVVAVSAAVVGVAAPPVPGCGQAANTNAINANTVPITIKRFMFLFSLVR